MINAASQMPERSSGVLLHPTSLPGPYGIGDAGPEAYRWVDGLAAAGQSWWQMLPLGPAGPAFSPYQSFSAFAGFTALVSPELLLRSGLLTGDDLAGVRLADGPADYPAAVELKGRLLGRAWERLRGGAAPALAAELEEFREREASWLENFALFAALKRAHGGKPWWEWPRPLARRDPQALAAAGRELAAEAARESFGQFVFFRQWGALRRHAADRGVRFIGDLPIFIADDSADVWAHPGLFVLKDGLRPTYVAGVPPDYFSATGQLWGNPLYDWEAMRRDGYRWWLDRFRAALRLVDLVRLDHFRGFEAYWQVPAGELTAQNGRWVPGPGAGFLRAVRDGLGGLPLIAEDLGVITPEVDRLREEFGLPGMKVLQFAFGGAVETRFLPHNHEHNTVVYTGTHDNDTTAGWYAALTKAERDYFHAYAPEARRDPCGTLVRLAWSSVGKLAVAPAQDLLCLDGSNRMNLPGTCEGNWRWRLLPGQMTASALDRLGELTAVYDRRVKRDAPKGEPGA